MKMLINGDWIDAADGGVIPVHNPANGEFLDEVPRAKSEDIARAIASAKRGYWINRGLGCRERARYLKAAACAIIKNIEELRLLMIRENGKPWKWADFEIRKTAEIFETLAERPKDPQGATYPMDSMHGCEGQIAFLYRQPRGVVGAILPFNFPAEMLAYKLGGALAAGNSIVVKLSEDCPLTCLRIGKLLLEAGAPAEAFHLLPGYGEEAGTALVEHPDVPMITFTGSSAVGRTIMAKAAKYLKHLSLELGGNDPVIVCEDADLDLIATNLVRGRMTVGNGQACVADKRFIVHHRVYEVLVAKCVAAVQALRMGDPSDPDVDVGPLVNEKAAVGVEEQIRAAVAQGAKIVLGGKRKNLTYIEPTILTEVTEEMGIFTDECFGPVAPFVRCGSDQEAIRMANNSIYGLQGAVYSRDISRAMQLADAMDVGGVVINGSSCFRPGNVPYMPRKQSGIGTDNMFNCYQEMTHGKAIVVQNAINPIYQSA